MTEFGGRLARARKARKLTQHAVALKTGFARTTILNYEKGLTAPRKPTVRALAETLGVSEAWLRTGRGTMDAEGGGRASPSGRAMPSGFVPGEASAGEVPYVEMADVPIVASGEGAAGVRERAPRVLSIPRDKLRQAGKCRAFEAQDNSMSPAIEKGDWVVFDALTAEPRAELVGRNFAVRLGGRLTVRTLAAWNPSKKTARLKSRGNEDRNEWRLEIGRPDPFAGLVVMILRKV